MNVIWIAVAAVSLLGLAFGVVLGYTSHHFAVEDNPVVEKIDETLPQSQCSQCGYPGCRPYVETISCNGEKINRCAPGDETVVLKIIELFSVEPQSLDGEAQELAPARTVTVVDENNCIGCAKCVQACPVGAIVGATRAVYTVMNDLCTGYNSCVDPYPAHYIPLQSVTETPDSQKWDLSTAPMHIIPVERHA